MKFMYVMLIAVVTSMAIGNECIAKETDNVERDGLFGNERPSAKRAKSPNVKVKSPSVKAPSAKSPRMTKAQKRKAAADQRAYEQSLRGRILIAIGNGAAWCKQKMVACKEWVMGNRVDSKKNGRKNGKSPRRSAMVN